MHINHERRLLSVQGVRFEGSAGDAMLLDSRVLHCGGENHSAAGNRRRMMYVTFTIPHCRPRGNLYSILPEYEGLLRLRDVANWGSIPLIEAEQQQHQQDASVLSNTI